MTEAAFNSLLDLRRRFLAFLERRVEDSAIAEDILQAAYVRALESKGKLRADESAVAWFYRILRNAVIDHLSPPHQRRRRAGTLGQGTEMATAPKPKLEETACQCIDGALEVIAPAYAEFLREVDLKREPWPPTPARMASRKATPRCVPIAPAPRCANNSSAVAEPAPSMAASIAGAA